MNEIIYAAIFVIVFILIILFGYSVEKEIKKYYHLYSDYTDNQLKLIEKVHTIKDEWTALHAIERIRIRRAIKKSKDEKDRIIQDLLDKIKEDN
jgi:hypothetical protein